MPLKYRRLLTHGGLVGEQAQQADVRITREDEFGLSGQEVEPVPGFLGSV